MAWEEKVDLHYLALDIDCLPFPLSPPHVTPSKLAPFLKAGEMVTIMWEIVSYPCAGHNIKKKGLRSSIPRGPVASESGLETAFASVYLLSLILHQCHTVKGCALTYMYEAEWSYDGLS